MKKLICSFIILSITLFTGCFNYKDIDKVIFATAIIIDVDNDGNPIIYVEAFKPARGSNGASGKGERVLFKGSRKTLFETERDINLSSSYKINFTQNRAIIFTQKAAEKNMYDFIDFFDRDQEFVIRSDIAILKGSPEKLINAKLKEQEYIGLFIHDLIYNIPVSSRAVITSLNDFLNKIHSKNNTSVLTMIELKQDQVEDKVEISNAAIVKDCKMVDILRRSEGLGYNFLVDNIKGGSLEVPNPDSPKKFVSLEILKNKTNTNVYYDGEKITVKKVINTRATVAEVQNRINLNTDTMNQLQKNAEKNISKACNNVFNEYKQKNLDIFNIGEDFQRSYPREKLENIIGKCNLELEVNVNIEGSSDKTNFR